jgi:tRNA pseudouridine38-40 synthase
MIKVNQDKHFLYIDIQADSFLYKMVRNIAGTLLEIGRGRFPRGSMKNILKSRKRKLTGQTLPAKGLCLLKVRY